MQSAPIATARTEFANLDLLRAIAVSLVLFFHLLKFFGVVSLGGFKLAVMGLVGVLFFFVHTCFVLMFSLERQQAKFGDQRLFTGFMIRRIFRIYPLSIFAVLCVAILQLPLSHLEPGHLALLSVGKLGLISNLVLAQNLTNTESILGPLWSLPYEMQMYVFLPILFLLARKLRSIRPLILLWILSVGVALVHAHFGHMPDLVKYVPCFLPGIIAYKSWNSTKMRWPFFGWALFLSALSVIVTITYRPAIGWLACLLLGLLVPRFQEMPNRPLRWFTHVIAKYSYGIYLAHYFCIWLAFSKFSFLPKPAQWVLFVIVMIGLPGLLYHALESPLINLGGRVVDGLFKPRRVPTLAAARTES